MARTPQKPIRPEDLPVLTELSETIARIPVLTEPPPERPTAAKGGAPGPMPLTDAQCRELAARLAPHLEAILREKFSRHFEALWDKSWRETENSLPDLIRDHLAANSRRSAK